ncbi:hypothetical protein [Alteromonas sp. ALT199]|nr:hypothetical protein [Alteromonas sp. ALT199]
MLAVIDQNPSISWDSLISKVDIVEEKPSDVELDIESEEDGLADFKL